MSEAALDLDPVAYLKLTDTFVESRIMDGEFPELSAASAEYKLRFFQRNLMRLVANWDLPRPGEEGIPAGGQPLPLPKPRDVVRAVSDGYKKLREAAGNTWIEVPEEELRCQVASFSYGMGAEDPITRVLFHKKDETKQPAFKVDGEAKPLRQKILVFWNPKGASSGPPVPDTIRRLTDTFADWAERQVEHHRALGSGHSPCHEHLPSAPEAKAVKEPEPAPAQMQAPPRK